MKFFLVIATAMLLCSCNSGATTPSSRTVADNDNTHVIEDVQFGNGVWNYSVATDYYYGTQNKAPSLKKDLSIYTNTGIQYVFADFGYLTLNGTTSSSSGLCNPSTPVDFQYYATPLIKDSAVPGVAAYLGNCVGGESVTAYYKSFLNNVVPMVEFDGSFLGALTTSQPLLLTQVADTIAQQINADPNAYGVGFDDEPSINSQSQIPGVGAANEIVFFGELAYKLAEHHKYLFLFDANAAGISLHQNGYKNSNLNNIVLLQPLYDLEDTSTYFNGPVSVNTYLSDAKKHATADLNIDSYPPMMYVAPASASDTIWDYTQGYNMVSSGKKYVPTTSLNNPAACQTTNATTQNSIDNGVLSLLLCSSTNVCPPTSSASGNISEFLDTQNCVNYAHSESVPDYFVPLLPIIKDAATTSSGQVNNRYIGTALYAWRISGMSDINCAKDYYSLEWATATNTCTQVFPMEISPTIWNAFNTWNWPN